MMSRLPLFPPTSEVCGFLTQVMFGEVFKCGM